MERIYIIMKMCESVIRIRKDIRMNRYSQMIREPGVTRASYPLARFLTSKLCARSHRNHVASEANETYLAPERELEEEVQNSIGNT